MRNGLLQAFTRRDIASDTPSRRIRISFLILRGITLILLLATAVGISPFSRPRELKSILLVDRSESMGVAGSGPERIEPALNTLTEVAEKDGPVSYGYFAGDVFLSDTPPDELRLDVEIPGETWIDRAIKAALNAEQGDGERRILLVSDGKASGGNAAEVARLAGEMGVPIYPFAPAPPPASGAELLRIESPSRIGEGEPFRISATYRSGAEERAALILFQNGREIGREELELQANGGELEYELQISEGGLHSIEAELRLPFDSRPPIRLGTMVYVQGRPSILLLSGSDARSPALARALRIQGFRVEERDSMEFSRELDRLGNYNALILNEVPAFDLSLESMRTIAAYVRDGGGGLVMLGGEGSFGSGGYYETPIEEILPVEMDPAASLFVPTLSMLTLLDTSGSMAKRNDAGESKLDILTEAVIAAAGLLNPGFQIGVIGFDVSPEWILPFTRAGEQQTIRDGLARLSAGGGTELYPALEEAYRGLLSASAAVKHLIVLSDGLVQAAPFEELVTRMADDGITITTVAIGADADRPLLENIASWGNGRSYYTATIDSTPRIFASESMIVAKRMLQNEVFFPRLESPHPILQGFDENELPPLFGFQSVYPKQQAQTLLTAVDASPLLSVFRPGLGRTTAFTSGFDSVWGREWIAWERFPRFVAQLVRWTARPGGSQQDRLRVARRESGAVAILEVRDSRGEPRSLENPLLIIESSRGMNKLALKADAPGRYSVELNDIASGEIRISAYDDRFLGMAGFINSTARERRPGPADTRLLRTIAESSGGRMLSAPEELSRYGPSNAREPRPIPLLYLTAALLLLLIDVLLRLAAGKGDGGVSTPDLAEKIEAQRARDRRRDPSFWFG